MIILKRRIRFELTSGQWTYWMTVEEAKRYSAEHIKVAVIEETMSYTDAMRYINPKGLAPVTGAALPPDQTASIVGANQ